MLWVVTTTKLRCLDCYGLFLCRKPQTNISSDPGLEPNSRHINCNTLSTALRKPVTLMKNITLEIKVRYQAHETKQLEVRPVVMKTKMPGKCKPNRFEAKQISNLNSNCEMCQMNGVANFITRNVSTAQIQRCKSKMQRTHSQSRHR